MMQLPTWAFWLGIELIGVLLILIIWLMLSWQKSSRRHRLETGQLLEKLRQLESSSNNSTALEDCHKQIQALHKQLQNERNNPFLQEKINALIAENEDLQEQLENLK